MLDKRRLAAQPDEKREELFTQRYEDLLAWAMRLTNQQRESAEDLVQDAFVQFMLGRTRLEEIENIDGYLRRMLRYMHLARMSRKAHLYDKALSIAEYDSFRLSWTAIEPQRRMQATEELRQICAYACARKESSRAGSVLILRFFHDYFPTEIASILSSSRHCVDQWQRLARREVKLFIDEPNRLRFVVSKSSAELSQIKYSGSDCDLMAELRGIIFSSCHGECLSKDQLQELYSSGNAEALTTSKLAHIVSCPKCLDTVNSLLGLPVLATRYEAEPRDKKEPPHDGTGGGVSGGGTSGGGVSGLTTKLERRLREVGEHKPHELRIAVNGAVVSSLKVTSDVTELDLNLTQDERIEFIELFSEQGVQLLFLSVNDATVFEPEQWARVALSEGRTLEARLRLENGPSLRVVYKEPASEEISMTEALEANAWSSPLTIVHVPVGPEVIAMPGAETPSWFERFCGVFRVKRQRLFSDEEIAEQDREVPFLTLGRAPRVSGARRWMRPGLVTALVSAVIIAAFLFYKAGLAPTLTATNLLEQARAAEQINSRVPDQISHRYINLEERRSSEGAVVSRRRIEIWQNHARGDRAQRLYDENNRLVSGTWETANGARTVYNHGVPLQTQTTPPTTDSLLLNPEDIWQLEPSAKIFGALIGEVAAADVEQESTSYVISSEKERAIGASRLLKATLTLSKSNLHSIEQTLIVERGGELREYRFVEASFERLPSKNVAPAVFEVEPELQGGNNGAGIPGRAHQKLTSTLVPPSFLNSTLPNASAELEVDVAYLLNQAKADRNEQISLSRTASGLLRVEGVVDDQERKQELLRALAPVSNNPAVKIEIRTVAEATNASRREGSVTVLEAEETADSVAVDSELRDYFSKGNKAAATHGVDEAVRSFSSRMVNRGYRTLFHAIELKRLVNRFANIDMRTVTPDARAKWLEMLRQHATAFERESGLLRQDIQPVFFAGASSNVSDDSAISNDVELARAVERLHSLALSSNQAIRSAFTISSQSSNAVKSSQFWRSLVGAEKLAARIRQYGG